MLRKITPPRDLRTLLKISGVKNSRGLAFKMPQLTRPSLNDIGVCWRTYLSSLLELKRRMASKTDRVVSCSRLRINNSVSCTTNAQVCDF